MDNHVQNIGILPIHQALIARNNRNNINNAKAKKLLSKAYVAAQRTDNSDLKAEITKKIASM